MNYNKWFPQNDPLREKVSERGMDAYFNTLLTDKDAPQENGAPVTGYRFMLKGMDGRLYSPFSNSEYNPDKEAFADLLKKGLEFAPEAEMWQLPVEKAEATTFHTDQVNVDATGRGYFYWPDKELAEDYMRAYIYRSGFEEKRRFVQGEYIETNDYNTNIWIHTAPDDVTKAGSFDVDLRFREAKDDPSIIDTRHVFTRPSKTTLVLCRVEGEAVVEEGGHGDAGFIMNNMKIDPDPIIEINSDEIYNAVHKKGLFSLLNKK